MKLKFDFVALTGCLDYVTAIVEDKLLDETMRNIIFKVTQDKVTLTGYNRLVTCHTVVPALEVLEIASEVQYMQIKAKELNDFLNTFKTLGRTKATDVEFFTDKNKVRMFVYEEPIEGDADTESRLSQKSTWSFDDIPIKEIVMREINAGADSKATEMIASVDVLLYLNSLLPLVADDAGSSVPSRMFFGEEYVFVIPRVFATLFENQLPSSFKGVVFSHSSLGFLKKLLACNSSVFVEKTDTHLCISTDTSLAILKYDTKMPDTRLYVDSVDKSNAISMDRIYLKDVLKRLSLIKESISVEICPEDMTLSVSNTKFKQIIPLLRVKGLTENLKFKLPTDVFASAIVGDDTLFAQELFIYIKPVTNAVSLVVTDSSGQWKSFLQAR